MAILFFVQIMVGGFCLLTTDAHAMAQSAQTQNVHAHCASFNHTDDQHSQDHSGNCYHCDHPDQLSNAVFSPVAPTALVLSGVINLSIEPQPGSNAAGLFIIRTPTGQPRSSSHSLQNHATHSRLIFPIISLRPIRVVVYVSLQTRASGIQEKVDVVKLARWL